MCYADKMFFAKTVCTVTAITLGAGNARSGKITNESMSTFQKKQQHEFGGDL